MPIVDLSLDASDDLIGERVVAIPAYGQGEHADFPPAELARSADQYNHGS
jgi:hypothetical protein